MSAAALGLLDKGSGDLPQSYALRAILPGTVDTWGSTYRTAPSDL